MVRKEYESELEKVEKEKADLLQLDMNYVKQLEQEELHALKEQEEKDRAAAYVLQEEEMDNLGVTLKSPTEHQRKLLPMLKPKSPMKLRKVLPVKKGGQTQKQRSSMNHYFTSDQKPM